MGDYVIFFYRYPEVWENLVNSEIEHYICPVCGLPQDEECDKQTGWCVDCLVKNLKHNPEVLGVDYKWKK